VETVYLSLGSNLGHREENLKSALQKLKEAGVIVNRRSSVYETEPQDVIEQPWFLNIAVEAATNYSPLQLLATTQRIEREVGRGKTPRVRRGPRVIDIDILLYGDVVMDTPQLTIPHPRLTERRFVLEPLMEIAPELMYPVTKEPLKSFLPQVFGQKLNRI